MVPTYYEAFINNINELSKTYFEAFVSDINELSEAFWY